MSESFACDNPAAAAATLGFRESAVHRGLSAVHGVHDEAGHFPATHRAACDEVKAEENDKTTIVAVV